MAHGGRRQSSAKVNILLNLIFHEMFIKEKLKNMLVCGELEEESASFLLY